MLIVLLHRNHAIFLVLLSSDEHSRKSGQGYYKECQPDTEGISGSRNFVHFLRRIVGGSSDVGVIGTVVAAVIAALIITAAAVIVGSICSNGEVGACDTVIPYNGKGMAAGR